MLNVISWWKEQRIIYQVEIKRYLSYFLVLPKLKTDDKFYAWNRHTNNACSYTKNMNSCERNLHAFEKCFNRLWITIFAQDAKVDMNENWSFCTYLVTVFRWVLYFVLKMHVEIES